MRRLIRLVPMIVGLAAVLSVETAAAPVTKTRDVCIASSAGAGNTYNTFVFRNVDALSRGGAIELRGLYFVTGGHRVAPLHGTAVMGSDGNVRVGFFVHSTAESTNDFTVAGVTDANFAGTLSFDSDGDFLPNGTLAAQQVDCATLSIP